MKIKRGVKLLLVDPQGNILETIDIGETNPEKSLGSMALVADIKSALRENKDKVLEEE